MSVQQLISDAYRTVGKLEMEPMLPVWGERLLEVLGHEYCLQAFGVDNEERCLVVRWWSGNVMEVTCHISQDGSVKVVLIDASGVYAEVRADDVEALLEERAQRLYGVLRHERWHPLFKKHQD